ncbi:MAG: Transglutaminase-like enzyme putative cysteine protease [Acidobacteria bacterium]|nr:Transglutaminase-like enzyme putative cysteine protease [Acidobacteriota bacterium]
MSFNTYFRASSYAMIIVATLALVWAGALHWSLAVLFGGATLLSWQIEGTRWQISERTGLILVLISIPVFYLDWSYQSALRLTTIGELQTNALVSAIAHLIVVLSAIKLLQVKSDRDWVFLYLISFFEVLLAAGLSLSPVFLASLGIYLVSGVSTVIAFEIYKARRRLKPVATRFLVADSQRRSARRLQTTPNGETRRLPVLSVAFLFLIVLLALPLFLVAPRAGAAAFTRRGSGPTNFIGFSENVQLGELGTLKANDQVVMHVRIEDSSGAAPRDLKWRGVALDEFTGRAWKKSLETRRAEKRVEERCETGGEPARGGCGVFPLDTTEALHRLTIQTIFLEPMDAAVIFAAPRAVAVQGPFPFLRMDGEGAIQSRRHEFERLIYRAVSDTTAPEAALLRQDAQAYPVSYFRYLQRPESLDPRIEELAHSIVVREHARNSYDAARAIETALRNDYNYSLQMKASGPDPLSDFLFNVREGHCEYFSTAMAVMLRTQGIPARVVNGFLTGEYNDAAGAYTVRQSDAHSWVEVYFPATKSWVTFDPTPAAGRTTSQRAGLAGLFGKYAEAFELMWFQYVIGYDKQEQRSLATSLNNRLFRYRHTLSDEVTSIRKLPGGFWQRILLFIMAGVFVFLTILLLRRIRHFGWRRVLRTTRAADQTGPSAIEFYERLTSLLAARGLKRGLDQTPLEFAVRVGWQEVMGITQAYNRVRYGADKLAPAESRQIEDWLQGLERPVQTARQTRSV